MPSSNSFSTAQLRQALQLSEQIESLQDELQALLSGGGSTVSEASSKKQSAAPGRPRGKRGMSPAARARIGAAARARWAKLRQSKEAAPAKASAKVSAKMSAKTSAKERPKKRGLTPEGRAKLAEAMKARWAARKKGAAAPNAPSA
jgi:hypothetical protein